MSSRPKLALAALLAFLLLETAWIAWVLAGDRTIDYYAYDVASAALQLNRIPYGLDQADRDAIAAARGIAARHEVPPYLYSPLLASLLLPLQALTPQGAALAWSLANLLALGLAGLLLSHLLSGRWVDARVFVGLVLFVPVLTSFYAGQVNPFILLSLAAASWALVHRRPRDVGVALALGILVKLMPVSVAALLLVRRCWVALGWLVVAGAAVAAATLPAIGLAPWIDYLGRAIGLASAGTPVVGANQSLAASAIRLAGPAIGGPMGQGLALLVVVLTAWVVWRARDDDRRVLPSIGLAVTGVALAAPLSWIHHQLLLALPMVILLRVCEGTVRRVGAWVVVLSCIVLLDVVGLAWKTLAPWPALASLGSLGMLMLWLALWRETAAPVRSGSG